MTEKSKVVRIPLALWTAAKIMQRRTGDRSVFASLQRIAIKVTNTERALAARYEAKDKTS